MIGNRKERSFGSERYRRNDENSQDLRDFSGFCEMIGGYNVILCEASPMVVFDGALDEC
jgi:hypothetical protein